MKFYCIDADQSRAILSENPEDTNIVVHYEFPEFNDLPRLKTELDRMGWWLCEDGELGDPTTVTKFRGNVMTFQDSEGVYLANGEYFLFEDELVEG